MDFDRGIELIVGPMFCGKTEELMRRIRRAEIAKRNVKVFKPVKDDRYSKESLSTHYGLRMPGIAIKNIDELIRNLKEGTEIIGIDEIQLLDDRIIDFSIKNQMNYLFIFAGLSLDFRGEPFKFRDSERHIGELMPYSKVTSLSALCTKCGRDAYSFTQRLIDGNPAPYDSPLILVGGKETYEARCIKHFITPIKNHNNS